MTPKEYNKYYYSKYSDKIKALKKAQRAAQSPEKRNAAHKKWAEKNKGRVAFLASRKRAARRNASPKWLTKEHWSQIREIYENCPQGFHVDHIIPIMATNEKNERVACGLHVPWNLQYLPASENVRKHTKMPKVI